MDGILLIHPDLEHSLPSEIHLVKKYIFNSKAKSTQKAYASDWKVFNYWCKQRSLVSLPAMPETVALFLSFSSQKWSKPFDSR